MEVPTLSSSGWMTPEHSQRWADTGTTYTTYKDASVQRGSRIEGEYRTNWRGKLQLRTGARAVRLRKTGQKWSRRFDKMFGSDEVKAQIKQKDNAYAFDKNVNMMVSAVANGDIKSHGKLVGHFEAVFAKGKELAEAESKPFKAEEAVTRFRDTLEDSLALLKVADSEKYEKAMNFFNQFRNIEKRHRGIKAGEGREFTDKVEMAFKAQIAETSAGDKHPALTRRRGSLQFVPRPGSVPGCKTSRPLTTDGKSAIILQKDTSPAPKTDIESHPRTFETKWRNSTELPSLPKDDLRNYSTEANLATVRNSYERWEISADRSGHLTEKNASRKLSKELARAAEPLADLNPEKAAAAGTIANVDVDRDALITSMNGTDCAFFPEIHGSSHNHAVGIAGLDAALVANRKPALLFETANGGGSPKQEELACNELNETAEILMAQQDLSASQKAMELLLFEQDLSTMPVERVWESRSIRDVESLQLSNYAPVEDSLNGRTLDENSDRQLNRNQVQMERFLLLKRAFETETPIKYVPSVRTTDRSGLLHSAMPAAIETEKRAGRYPLAFFGAAHALGTDAPSDIDPASLGLARKHNGVSFMSEATLRSDAALEGTKESERRDFVGRSLGTVQLPGLSHDRGVRVARQSPLLAVRTRAHHEAHENLKNQPDPQQTYI